MFSCDKVISLTGFCLLAKQRIAFQHKMTQFPGFMFPGMAEALNGWGGRSKASLIAYFLSYISAKNYKNWMLAQVTAKRIRNCFRTQCIKRELTRRWDSERERFYDDIAHVLQNNKKRELTSFNKLDDIASKYCTLSLEFMNLLQNFHLAVIEYLYRGRHAVPLQTFTTRHTNRKLSIAMALSTTFTQ